MIHETANSQLLIYQSDDGRIKLDVRFEGETVWDRFLREKSPEGMASHSPGLRGTSHPGYRV